MKLLVRINLLLGRFLYERYGILGADYMEYDKAQLSEEDFHKHFKKYKKRGLNSRSDLEYHYVQDKNVEYFCIARRG